MLPNRKLSFGSRLLVLFMAVVAVLLVGVVRARDNTKASL
jgi:hypothetical protein